MSCKGKKQTRQITYEQMREHGQQFRSMRESIGLTLGQMADEVGIFRTTLSKWEKGLIIPQADMKYIIRKFNSVAAKYSS
jgi:transcriptional regulator with XRE-family HTH domain